MLNDHVDFFKKSCKSFLFGAVLNALVLSFAFAQTVTVSPALLNTNSGQPVTVRITTTDVEKCIVNGKPYNNFDVVKNGNVLLRPVETTEFVFSCTSKNNPSVSTSTKIRVTVVNQIQSSISNNLNSNNSGQNNISSQPRVQPQSQYSTQTLTNTANQLCGQYSSYSSVYPPAIAGTGGGSVPVDLTNLAPILTAINQNAQLTANEIRQQSLFRYCTEYANMARATARLAETSARSIKNIADNCYADERCLRDRVYKSSLEQEIKILCEDPLYGRELCELRTRTYDQDLAVRQKEEVEIQKYCNNMYDRGFYPHECVMVPKAFETIINKYYESENRIEAKQIEAATGFENGVMGSRPCIETASGRPPEEVKFYEPDCIRYRQEPSVVNEEVLRQITALPYTQAFSPSSVLGFDGVLDNINTRAREGNLIDPNISPTFGSGVSGTNNQIGNNSGTDLKSIETNYKKLTANIGVIVQLYDVARLAYASSTSVCKNLPVATRRDAVTRIDANKKTYADYLTTLKQMWEAAVARPRENHTQLILKINFDLKDKYNQTEIDKVYEATKKLLQVCVDANVDS